MHEVLTRRFRHGLEEQKELEEREQETMENSAVFRILLMMDGGKGQVNIALTVLEELGLSIPVCGMVKDDHHRTRGLYFQNKEIPIDKGQRRTSNSSQEFRMKPIDLPLNTTAPCEVRVRYIQS